MNSHVAFRNESRYQNKVRPGGTLHCPRVRCGHEWVQVKQSKPNEAHYPEFGAVPAELGAPSSLSPLGRLGRLAPGKLEKFTPK